MDALQKKLGPVIGALLSGLLLIPGCDSVNNTEPDVRQVKLTMTAGENAENPDKVNINSTSQWDTNKVELTEVKILVHELELKTVSDEALDFEVNNLIVNLPLNGDTLELATGEIPSGDYDKVKLEIDNADVSDPDLSDSTGYYSIVAKGTYNGEEFTFKTSHEFDKTFRFTPPITIADSTESLTLNFSVNVNQWFKFVDPTNPTDQHQVEFNIARSFFAHCRFWGWSPHYWRHDEHWGND